MTNVIKLTGDGVPYFESGSGSGTSSDPHASSVTLPVASSVTIVTAQTNATGANFTTFGSQACSQLDLTNTTGVDIEYQRNGTGNTFKVPNNSGRLIIGVTNANQIGIRRVDQSNTQVTVNAEAIS